MPDKTCTWSPSENEGDDWETGCGNEFMLMDAGPMEMDFQFCPFCGKALVEAPDETEL